MLIFILSLIAILITFIIFIPSIIAYKDKYRHRVLVYIANFFFYLNMFPFYFFIIAMGFKGYSNAIKKIEAKKQNTQIEKKVETTKPTPTIIK